MPGAHGTVEERDNEIGRAAVFGPGVKSLSQFMLCLQKLSRSNLPLSGSQNTPVNVMKENLSLTPKGKSSPADPFALSPSLLFLPLQIPIAAYGRRVAAPIRRRSVGHLSIKVNNVTTFTVADFHNKNTQSKNRF